jgi:ketosteroid isomerase-like protein
MSHRRTPFDLPASPEDTEAQFYEAMQAGDVDRVMAVWSDEDEVVCVHPGGARLTGVAEIRAGFETILANGGVYAEPERLRRVLTETTAVHSVLERVQVMSDEGPRLAWVIATNVYVRGPQGWRMVCHHASAGTAHEAREALEAAAMLH